MGVLYGIIFSHTPNEAMSGGLVKACVPGKIIPVLEKIEFLNTMLVGQTQYMADQPGKKRRHCTTLITEISLSSSLIQMQGNHLTREPECHFT